jgi:hypothetical protein
MRAMTTATAGQVTGGSPLRWLVLGVLVVAFGGMVVCDQTYGAQSRAAVERNRAADIALENRVLCGKFEFAPGTSALTTCLSELANYRRQAEKRIANETMPY